MIVEGLISFISASFKKIPTSEMEYILKIKSIVEVRDAVFSAANMLTHYILRWSTLEYAIICLVAWVVYNVAFKPLNRVKSMTDIGWVHLQKEQYTLTKSYGKTLAEKVNEVQRLRKKGNLPPVFPNGWFSITESRNLTRRQVLSVQALGQTFAVFRGEDGKVHVVDAYCPHLGANMAVGGVVKGSCIECPFHGWLFNGTDGTCASIPYAKKVPTFAKVRHWESREANGFVFVWHDAEDRGPLWKIPVVPGIESGEWLYRGRTEHEILAHIQEIPENGSDMAHLGHLHGPNVFKGADLSEAFANSKVYDFSQHEWSGGWEPKQSSDSHIATVTINHRISLCNGRLKLFPMTVEAKQIGPGIVHLYFNTALGPGVLVQTVTPIEPLRQRLIHQFYTARMLIAPIAKFMLRCEACQVERDIAIWNNKQFLSKPGLVAEDRLIRSFRKWYSQFYSENSPRFETFSKDDLEW